MSDINPSLTAQPGHCYVVATPIGNLADLSDRARGILASATVIASEDTRTTGALLHRYGLHRPLIAYHEHNELEAAEALVVRLATGESVAVVSDAGTPGLSDPGFRVVRACRRRGIPVVPVPGACAAIAVLSASGLPTNAFLFAGFLPHKTAARRTFLEKHRAAEHTLCLYESTHRIEAFVAEIAEVLGPARVVCLAKEVTKLHETFIVGPVGEVEKRFAPMSKKGEFVVLIAPEGFVL
jgi:16S rRNA (cytidine1402-2'-O)-methyltransferase